MSSYIITGDPREHGGVAPILVAEQFTFVHPGQINEGKHRPIQFATRAEALVMCARIPARLQVVEIDLVEVKTDDVRVLRLAPAEDNTGKPIVAESRV